MSRFARDRQGSLVEGPIEHGGAGEAPDQAALALREALARTRPRGRFVAVGPVRKIAAADAPDLPAIRVLGQQPYQDQPGYVRGSDVYVVPFAL